MTSRGRVVAPLSAPEAPEQDGMPEQGLVRRAGGLAERHGLRGCDSVHAAAAARIHENMAGGSDFGIAAFDSALRAAVESLGMKVLS